LAGLFGFPPDGGRRGIVRAVLLTVVLLLVLPYVVAPFYRFVDPVSTLMLWRWARGERVERSWTPLGQIAPALPLAVISAEDGRFCRHHGIDFAQVRAVIRGIDDVADLEEARGGSTITQQAAKNLFLWQGRSYVRKALEFPLAVWLDLVLPKRRLIEIYLNIAEWGPNGEFGADAAARRAFNRPAGELDAREATLLAAELPNPRRRDARVPSATLRRLAGIYQRRMERFPGLDACVRVRRASATAWSL
jgi:monofunctional biosynthetic peptidoglycan transglycosylase